MTELSASLFKCVRTPDFLKILSPYMGLDSYEVMHPSVIYLPQQEGFKSFRYWLAVTPYIDVPHENPCVYCSNDGYNWQLPPGALSPEIEPVPVSGHNSDPELFFDKDGKLYCFWRWTDNQTDQIYVRSTVDGINWSDKLLVLEAKAPLLMSPGIIRDTDDYRVWTCDANNIYLRNSQNLTSYWSAATPCRLDGSTPGHPWHLSVLKIQEQYIAIILFTLTTGGEGNRITVYTSKDGLGWDKGTELIIQSTTDSWDMVPYRACGILIEQGPKKIIKMYYSGYNQVGRWHTGVTDIDLGPVSSEIG